MNKVIKARSMRKGFTLVEVIVVMVIVAVLAAVAIPQYQAYVEDSRQGAVDNLAESASAMANSWYRRKGSAPAVTDLNLHFDDSKYTVEITETSITVSESGESSPKTATRNFK